MSAKELYHKLSWMFVSLGAMYLLTGLALWAFLSPLQADFLGISFSLTSMAKPARVSLGLLLLGCVFRYLYERNSDPGLTLNAFLDRHHGRAEKFSLRHRRLLGLLFCLLLIAGTAYFTGYKVRQQMSFHTNGYDLSVCDHAFYNTYHGAFLKAWGLERNYFSQHFSPIFLIILPFYYFWPSPVLLLAVQGLAAGGTVLAAALLGRRLGLPRLPALLAGFAFALHPKYWEGFALDFHQEMLFPLFFFLSVYFLLGGRMVAFYALSILALMIREDVALYLIAFAVYVTIRYSRPWGCVLLGTSVSWAIVAMYVAIPLAYPTEQNHSRLIMERYGQYGGSYVEIAKGIAAGSPEIFFRALAVSFRSLLKPLAYLPVLSPVYLGLGLFPIALNVCAASELQAMLAAYYGVVGLAFFMVGFLTTLSRLWRRSPLLRFAAAGLLAYVLSSVEMRPWETVLPSDRLLARRITMASWPGKTISAGTTLIPHLPRENRIYMFPQVDDADVILLYLRPGQDYAWPLDRERHFERVRALLRDRRFRVDFFESNILFLEKGERDDGRSREVLEILEDERSGKVKG